MTAKVTIIDYGVGNLLSVSRALEHVGAEPVLAGTAAAVAEADRVVLPGVGAFGPAMETLHANGLADAVREVAQTRQRPFLGICLGMQMMLDSSTEFGCHAGLGLVPGQVTRISDTGADGTPHRIPHIGWAPLEPAEGGGSWENSILRNTAPGDSVYFVHSFVARPTAPQDCIAVADYDGLPLAATIGKANIWGCQFHPEKSGAVGLRILESFLDV
jgi:glutamine amidotransferase